MKEVILVFLHRFVKNVKVFELKWPSTRLEASQEHHPVHCWTSSLSPSETGIITRFTG